MDKLKEILYNLTIHIDITKKELHIIHKTDSIKIRIESGKINVCTNLLFSSNNE